MFLWRIISYRYRLVAFDNAGHGLSDHIPKGLSYSITEGLVVFNRIQVI